MSGRKEKNIRSAQKIDVNGSFIRAVSEGNLSNVKTLVNSHGLSCCEGWYGGYALLRDTIELGHFEIAKFLLQGGAKVHCETDGISTPLHFAARKNNIELVQLLLENNASVNACNGQNETALHLAAKQGCVDIVLVLLDNNASLMAQTDDGSTPLLLAVEGRHQIVVRMLLKYACANLVDENVASVSQSSSTLLNRILLCNQRARQKIDKLVLSIVNSNGGHNEIVDDLIDHSFVLSREYVDKSLLVSAMKKRHTKLVKSMLTVTNPNDAKHNFMLLHTALKENHQKIVKLFLNFGSEANNENEEGSHCSEDLKLAKVIEQLLAAGADTKETPLLIHLVVKRDFVEVCKVLIKNGANINALNKKSETPLHLCCGFVRYDRRFDKKDQMVKLLLDNGADVSIKTDCGVTAFHLAVMHGRKEAVSIFLSFGIDVDLRDRDGLTPLHFALNGDIAEILCRSKAYVNARTKAGRTPLHQAANFDSKVVETLLKFGADAEARTLKNETALHFAFSRNDCDDSCNVDNIRMLLQNGCDANAKSKKGRRVLDIALSKAESNFNDEVGDSFFGSYRPSFDAESNLSDECVKGVKIIKEHLIKLETAGLSKKYPDRFDQITEELISFQGKCEAEVKRMKNEKLSPRFSLYDILANRKKPTFAKDQALMQAINSFNLDKFPVYKSLIESVLKRLDLTRSACKSLQFLVRVSTELNRQKRSVLSAELSELVVSYLSVGELKGLIHCGEAIKKQLNH